MATRVPRPATVPSRPTAGQRPQMADIARMAGVSVATVSRALSGSPLINADTRIRIEALARSLNYSVNVGAQNLRLKQNRTVSVVVPFDVTSREQLSDPFFLSLLGSIADALTDSGWEMLLSRIDSGQLEQAAHAYESGRAAGVVLIGQWHQHDRLNAMAVRGLPLVVWGARLPDQLYLSVGSDNLRGGRLAATHLLAQGARRIAFFGDAELPEVAQRHAGFLQAHADLGLQSPPELTRKVPFVPEHAQQEVAGMLAAGIPFDGIVAASDVLAMSTIQALRRHGRRVPEDVAVVGYDDIPLAAYFVPALTTVRQPIEAAGRALVDLLIAQLDGRKAAPVMLATELAVRESARLG